VKPYRLTEQAAEDMDSIWLFIAEDNIDAAYRMMENLTRRFKSIAEMPDAGRNRSDLAPGLRSHLAGSYIIFYHNTQEAVIIDRVIHGARDLESQF
jgi:toxin ParE1/3/4